MRGASWQMFRSRDRVPFIRKDISRVSLSSEKLS